MMSSCVGLASSPHSLSFRHTSHAENPVGIEHNVHSIFERHTCTFYCTIYVGTVCCDRTKHPLIGLCFIEHIHSMSEHPL